MTIVDTNLLSEAIKPVPSAPVLRWLASQAADQLYTTTISEAELLYGIELLPHGRRRTKLEDEINGMLTEDFFGRILAFDRDAARAFATISAGRRRKGQPIREMDAQIAAIAFAQGAALATRNTGDFEDCGVKLINPWHYSN
jgi:hypothetical protein